MRNGLNITGVSEMVHEIREYPAEAIAAFAVQAPAGASAPGTVTSRTLTARNGTVRMARDFRLAHRFALTPDGSDAPPPTPYESALASLGACVLVTTVNGYTARGVTLGGISVTVRAELALDDTGRPAAGRPLENIRWRCDVDCDADVDTARSINRLVTAFSPNHRIFLDEAPFDSVGVTLPDGRTTPVTLPPPAISSDFRSSDFRTTCSLEATVTWEYGSEGRYSTAVRADGVRHESGPWPVDQAKQMLGIDRAPNSQEILLAALCAELTALLSGERIPVRLRAEGRLDTRGMLNVTREAPSRFHGLALQAAVPDSTIGATALTTALTTALSRSVLVATLAAPRAVDVALWLGGERVVSVNSTTADAEAVRDELTQR
ncbi:OsmC family protein [Streptomyces sp. NBC_01142]|uniref:OsmC family protein n=1 Tax=Streptomyces sp. NBC_01142 TaxID=2975865 RepID=UPI0022554987|nr:OsmC family protein [Streptomyces sp. NBC_01142]MCX4820794.1 OsmC family protein [Streptomyces sp. NBC_01142]